VSRSGQPSPLLIAELEALSQRAALGVDTLRTLAPTRLGACERELAGRVGRARLYRYAPRVESPHPVPLLIIYALVNRPDIADLEPGRSLIGGLLDAGQAVHLIEWEDPQDTDRSRNLDDYVNRDIDGCVDVVSSMAGTERVNLLGICQGGTLSLCYSALHPDKVGALVTMVTPVDFHTPDNLLGQWVRHVDVDLLVDALGNVPGELLNRVFLALKPLRLGGQKYLDVLEQLPDPARAANFLRMERWIEDSPAQAGTAFREFVKGLFQQNRLVRGTFEIGGRRIDLGAVRAPVLNVYATRDHLVPPASSQALRQHVGTDDYTELAFQGGHIGIYVSRRAQREIPPRVAGWLALRR
jgi:polyhydroxyalkanoate synthase